MISYNNMNKLAALAALGLLTGVAHADIVFFSETQVLPTSENVVFNVPGLITTGTLVQGQLGISGHVYDFLTTEDLTTPSTGVARVEAVDGAFTSLDIRPNTGVESYTGIIFDINAADDGLVTLTATDGTGSLFNGQFSLSGAGSNPFTILAINGQVITNVTISSNVALTDVRSFRIDGSVEAVPEPSTMAALATGTLLFWRRRAKSRS